MNELAAGTDAEGESPFAETRTPRLSILHLMLWTLCTAVYLSLMRAITAMQGELPSGYAAMETTSSVVQGIVAGAVLMGAIVLVSTRVRSGPPMLRQPGHWLLLVSAFLALVYLPFMAVQLLLQHSGFYDQWFITLYGILHLFAPIAYSLAVRRSPARRWKLIFVGLAVIGLTQCLVYIGIGLATSYSWFPTLFFIPSLGSLLLAGAVLVVLMIELAAGEPRDWVHWTGVVTHVASSSVTLLWMIGSWFVSSFV